MIWTDLQTDRVVPHSADRQEGPLQFKEEIAREPPCGADRVVGSTWLSAQSLSADERQHQQGARGLVTERIFGSKFCNQRLKELIKLRPEGWRNWQRRRPRKPKEKRRLQQKSGSRHALPDVSWFASGLPGLRISRPGGTATWPGYFTRPG